LADLLGHPVKQWVLKNNNFLEEELSTFAQRIVDIVHSKFNRHLYDGHIEGYGWVLYPKKNKGASERHPYARPCGRSNSA
jgi:hypothetical protein